MASSIHSQFEFPALALFLLTRGAFASLLYIQNRAKEKDEASRKQKNECKNIACHF
jgi:hypothetical protein